jgi:hypothetical protein
MKNLKLIFSLAAFAIAFIFCACKKQTSNKNNTLHGTIVNVANQQYKLQGTTNAEMTRLATDINATASTLSITKNLNNGAVDIADQLGATNFGGITPPSVSIKVNGAPYRQAAAGGWYQENQLFKTYYGKQIQLTTINEGAENNYTFYSPKEMQATKLGVGNSVSIARVGNTLRWTPDAQNLSGKIVISYKTFTDDFLGDRLNPYSGENIITDDDGAFEIDDLLADPKVKRIYIKIGRGNGISVKFPGHTNPTFFNIKSIDHHEYLVN